MCSEKFTKKNLVCFERLPRYYLGLLKDPKTFDQLDDSIMLKDLCISFISKWMYFRTKLLSSLI